MVCPECGGLRSGVARIRVITVREQPGAGTVSDVASGHPRHWLHREMPCRADLPTGVPARHPRGLHSGGNRSHWAQGARDFTGHAKTGNLAAPDSLLILSGAVQFQGPAVKSRVRPAPGAVHVPRVLRDT